MNGLFIGRPSHWLLLTGLIALLGWAGSAALHVRAFGVFVGLVLGLAFAAVLVVVMSYRTGDSITREPVELDD